MANQAGDVFKLYLFSKAQTGKHDSVCNSIIFWWTTNEVVKVHNK